MSKSISKAKQYYEEYKSAVAQDSWGWYTARQIVITLLVVVVVGVLDMQIGVLTGAPSLALRAAATGLLLTAFGLIFRNFSATEYSGHELLTNVLLTEDWSDLWYKLLGFLFKAITIVGGSLIAAAINWGFFNSPPFVLTSSENLKPAAVSLGAYFFFGFLAKVIIDHTHAFFSLPREVLLARGSAGEGSAVAASMVVHPAHVDNVLIWRAVATGVAYAATILTGEMTGGAVNFWRHLWVAVVNGNTAGRASEFWISLASDLTAPFVTVIIYLFLFRLAQRRSTLKWV